MARLRQYDIIVIYYVHGNSGVYQGAWKPHPFPDPGTQLPFIYKL
jgi:hypothetical protein